MKANVRSQDGLLQICYDLPHRVHTSKVYPLASSNGSAIIVYGHEQGLRCMWRGGRSFKKYRERVPEKPKLNGTSKDVVMILDSSDEEPVKEATPEDGPTFHDEEDEYNPSEPYEPCIQTLDVLLGVEVLHLSFPRLPPDLHRSSLPPLVLDNVVVAVACSDFSIRVITFPLTPPSPQTKASSELRDKVTNLKEQMVMVSSGTVHQSIPKGVSISMTASFPEDEDVDMDDADDSNGILPSSRHTSRSRSRSRPGIDQTWDLLIASHSADLSGLLLIHRIPLVSEGTSISTETHIPWRTQYLASPAVSVEFSSALYPASRHSQLLVAEAKGSVRLFDCLPKSSGAQGSWLASLYTDFESSQNSIPRRKPILDAQWVLGGKGIMVLQADGKWGIWNHEGRGPKSAQEPSSIGNQSLGLLTTFALDGYAGASLKSKPLLKSSNTRTESRSKLAPMTPGTRKMKQDALFTSPSSIPDSPARGGLCIVPTPETTSSKPDDESILLWYGTTAMVIPSLHTHWQNKVRGSGNLFGSGANGEPKTINNIQLGGEFCNEVALIPSDQHAGSAKDSPEILGTGEKRLLIITPPLKEPQAPEVAVPPPVSTTTDQQLLAKGELDVNGMDRILAGMSNGHTSRRNSQASKGRSLLSL